jgi:ATP-dependent DNA helicase RecG
MLAHEVDRGAVDWAGLRVGGAEWTDLDPLEFERLRRMVGNASGGADRPLGTLSDREIASALGFKRHDAEVTTGGLLMFEPLIRLTGLNSAVSVSEIMYVSSNHLGGPAGPG